MRRKQLLFVGMLLLIGALLSSSLSSGQVDKSSIRLQEARSDVEHAFSEVQSTQDTGANVTGLLERLNVAVDLLAQAENAYRSGDLTSAEDYAIQVTAAAKQVTAQSMDVQQSAFDSTKGSYLFSVVVVTVGSLVFVLALFLVWRHFKTHYVTGILKSKPEAVADN